MAKSKEGQTSKGQRPNVNRKILNAVRKERTELDRTNNAWKAWKKGKKIFITKENPNSKETNKPFIRVPATDVWGKYMPYQMRTKSDNDL